MGDGSFGVWILERLGGRAVVSGVGRYGGDVLVERGKKGGQEQMRPHASSARLCMGLSGG